LGTEVKESKNRELAMKLNVIHEDNHLLVVFKPHRLLIQSDERGGPTLFRQACEWLKEKYQKPGNVYLGMIHRLDRPVSGLVVFGKTSKGASRLSEQMRQKNIKKKYLALVEGRINPPSGVCTHFITPPLDSRSLVFEKEQEGTKKAELAYEVLASKNNYSLVSIDLITGRRHQIRAQLAHLGSPIVGDGRYGAKTPFLEGSIALIASELKLSHPTTDELLHFKVPTHLNFVEEVWNEL